MLHPSIDTTDTLIGLSTALGAGLLIGVERERSKGRGMGRGAAGVRTFTLLALTGSIAALLGSVATVVAGIFVALAMFASYRRTQVDDPGLTTEVAMLATYLLGLLAMRSPALAGGLGVVVALLLASKAHLHHFTRDRLSQQELHDALIFVAAAFVVLPLLPDRTIDPWHSINPRRLWILVVAVMGVSSAGYVALRIFGSKLGLAITGLAGGFVSSTATIAAMGDKAKTTPELVAAFASAGLLSNVGTVVQLAIVIGALSPALLLRAIWPLAMAGTVAIAAAALSSRHAFYTSNLHVDVSSKRPFAPMQVLAFAAIMGTVVFLAAIARHWLGEKSLPWVLAASGLADVHAAAASAAQLNSSQQLDQQAAMVAISAALAANSLTKCAMAGIKGGRRYARRVIPGIVLMVLTFAATVMLQY